MKKVFIIPGVLCGALSPTAAAPSLHLPLAAVGLAASLSKEGNASPTNHTAHEKMGKHESHTNHFDIEKFQIK